MVFGFAFEWIFIVIGLVSGTAQAAQQMGLVITPLVFLSSAYVPVASMPGGVRQFSEVQPVTPMVDAGLSLVWAAAIFVVFGLLAVLRFARR